MVDLVLQVAEVVLVVVVAEGEEVEPNQVTQLPGEYRQIMELLADKENSINFRTGPWTLYSMPSQLSSCKVFNFLSHDFFIFLSHDLTKPSLL